MSLAKPSRDRTDAFGRRHLDVLGSGRTRGFRQIHLRFTGVLFKGAAQFPCRTAPGARESQIGCYVKMSPLLQTEELLEFAGSVGSAAKELCYQCEDAASHHVTRSMLHDVLQRFETTAETATSGVPKAAASRSSASAAL